MVGGPGDGVLFTPGCIGTLGFLAEFVVRSLKDHPKINLWMILLHCQDLSAILTCEQALCLQVDTRRQDEVRRVVALQNVRNLG